MRLRISKRNAEEIMVVIILLIMSSGGLSITRVSSTNVTPFYFVGLLTIFLWLFKHLYIRKFERHILLWAVISVGISLLQINNTKILSIIHFAFYVIVSISILQVCKITENVIEKLTKLVVYLNLSNILIAFCLYHIGASNIPMVFGTYYNRGVMRYMGFTSEPSYLAMESTACIIAYILTSGKKIVRQTWWLLIAYVVTILLSKTSFGLLSVIFVAVVFFKYCLRFSTTQKRTVFLFIFAITMILSVGIGIMFFSDATFLSRILGIIELVFSSHSLQEFQVNLRLIDSSAWYRFGPLLLALGEAKLTSLATLFGHGIGADAEYFTMLTGSDTVIRGGFLQAGFYNQGLVGLLVFLCLSIKKCKPMGIVSIIYLLLCFSNCSISTQAFWFIMIIYISTSRILESRKRLAINAE